MIANCPTCGTHYKHEPPAVKVRARCVRCDTRLFLAPLSPYRIVLAAAPFAEQAAFAGSHQPIGLDHPALAETIARNIARTAPTELPVWTQDNADDDPLPPIREMTLSGAYESSVPSAAADDILGVDARGAFGRPIDEDVAPDAASHASGGATTFVLWLATGAIAGTGASWTLGGTTMSGIAAGVVLGALAGWGWQKWMSPK